ncbi:MAG: DNA-binding response regulator [Nitriliruptor sp.]|nr:MAG: DNA-binding response regulator [Nitriliruptor sp.]
MAHTVVLVDDHEVVRAGLRTAIERSECGLVVIGEGRTVAEASELIERGRPDIVIVDVVLPDGDGIQLCREVTARYPATACVLLTSFPEPGAMLSAALAGAAAYEGKDSSATDILGVIAAVGQGRRLLDDQAVSELLEQLSSLPAEEAALEQLTGQERRVFELMGQGLSNRQIAERLYLTERTVKNYSSRLLGKLEMERRSEAAALSARLSERRAQEQIRRSVGPDGISAPGPAGPGG